MVIYGNCVLYVYLEQMKVLCDVKQWLRILCSSNKILVFFSIILIVLLKHGAYKPNQKTESVTELNLTKNKTVFHIYRTGKLELNWN